MTSNTMHCFACKRAIKDVPLLVEDWLSTRRDPLGVRYRISGGQRITAKRRYYDDDEWALIAAWETRTGRSRLDFENHSDMPIIVGTVICERCSLESEAEYERQQMEGEW